MRRRPIEDGDRIGYFRRSTHDSKFLLRVLSCLFSVCLWAGFVLHLECHARAEEQANAADILCFVNVEIGVSFREQRKETEKILRQPCWRAVCMRLHTMRVRATTCNLAKRWRKRERDEE